MSKVGVFVCHCGENIARNVKVEEVVDFAKDVPGAVFTADYPYLCSAPGQKMLIDAIEEHGLDRVVVAACSPQLHEPTFRAAAAQAGLNPYLWRSPTSASTARGSTATPTRLRQRRARSSPRRSNGSSVRNRSTRSRCR